MKFTNLVDPSVVIITIPSVCLICLREERIFYRNIVFTLYYRWPQPSRRIPVPAVIRFTIYMKFTIFCLRTLQMLRTEFGKDWTRYDHLTNLRLTPQPRSSDNFGRKEQFLRCVFLRKLTRRQLKSKSFWLINIEKRLCSRIYER